MTVWLQNLVDLVRMHPALYQLGRKFNIVWNRYAICLQLHICINVKPTCFGGQATTSGGAKGYRLRSASKVAQYYI